MDTSRGEQKDVVGAVVALDDGHALAAQQRQRGPPESGGGGHAATGRRARERGSASSIATGAASAAETAPRLHRATVSRCARDGQRFPLSHIDTVASDTESARATSVCDRPRVVRWCRSARAQVVGFMRRHFTKVMHAVKRIHSLR